jgi:DNA repair protein RadC
MEADKTSLTTTTQKTNMKAYKAGTTHRITVTSVRQDPCEFSTDTPERLAKYWREVIAAQPDFEPDKETLVAVMMNTRLRPFAWHRVSLGTVNESSAHPREIFRPVIAAAAFGFALMHNHPSGDPSPSKADEHVTRRINEAATLLQIKFLDHLVIGDQYFSFREAGII